MSNGVRSVTSQHAHDRSVTARRTLAASYLAAVLLPALNAVIPVLPSETAVVALGVATAGRADPRIAGDVGSIRLRGLPRRGGTCPTGLRPGAEEPAPAAALQPQPATFYISALISICGSPESRRFCDRERTEGKRHTRTVLAPARRRVNVGWACACRESCTCRKPRPGHATRRYSWVRPPARVCFRTRCWSRWARFRTA
jgi:hypothetical protein